MAYPPLSDATLLEAVDALATHGSEYKAAAALGIPRPTLASRVKAAASRGITAAMESPDSPKRLKERIKQLESALRTHEKRHSDIDLVKRHIGTLDSGVEKCHTPDWVVEPSRSATAPGVPTLFCSDWHCGETVYPSQINGVNKYNIQIFRERVRELLGSALHLLRIISPKMDYPGIVVPLGGDMISGNIHDELTATNELNSMPAVLELFGVLVWLIDELLKQFGKIFLPCVSGNHGRDTTKIWNKDRHHTSFDWLLYQFLAKHYANDKRVQFFIPDGPDAYYRIYGHRYLLTHGDQFRGGDGMIGALGPIIRGDHKKRSRNAQIDMEYDTMIIGHWHQYIHLTRLIVNGALKGYDEYAYNNNFSFELPQQALWITHPKYRITFRMPVFVDKAREPIKTTWVAMAA